LNFSLFSGVFILIKAVPLVLRTFRWLIRNAITYQNKNVKSFIGNRLRHHGTFNQRQQLHRFAGGANLWTTFFGRFFFFNLSICTVRENKPTKDFILGYTLDKQLWHSNKITSRYMAYRKRVVIKRAPLYPL
jgi:hypothetical protein